MQLKMQCYSSLWIAEDVLYIQFSEYI